MSSSWETALVPLPVLLPLLGSGAALVLSRFPRVQRTLSVVVLLAVVAVSATLLTAADRDGPQVVWLGGWRGLGVALVADRLAALMLVVSSVVTLAVLLYSLGQGVSDGDRTAPVSIYHPTYLTLVAGISNAFLAGDLFNLFVSFEILLFASYVLLTLGGTAARVRAGTIYVVVNVVSSMLFLVAIAVAYAAVGTLNLAQLSVRLADLPAPTSLLVHLLLLVVFAIKAAVFPLSLWLPDSYPTAPAPVTAVFAGLLTKVGVYAIIRTQTLLFPDTPLTALLLSAALATMVVGILGAVAQSDLKRLLSFTLVSHIGYMLLGIGLASTAGLSGAIFYVVHHITVQTTLFLVVGLVEWQAGSTALLRLGGLARLFPVLGVLFFLPAMNLAGIPPLSGFLGKVGLLQAGLADGSALALVLVAAGAATSLLTLYAVAKAWALAFWRTPAQAHEVAEQLAAAHAHGGDDANELADDRVSDALPVVAHRGHVHVGAVTVAATDVAEARRVAGSGTGAGAGAGAGDTEEARDLFRRLEEDAVPARLPVLMVAPAAGLVALGLALSVVAGPLFSYTDAAAADLRARTPYVAAVLSAQGPPGSPATAVRQVGR